MTPPSDRAWARRLYSRFTTLWYLKALGTTVFMVLFFQAYFRVQQHPLREPFTMPMLAIDDWVPFTPAGFAAYVSLWVYVSLPAAFMPNLRSLIVQGLWTAALCIFCLLLFWVFPTQTPVLDIDWSQHPQLAFMKSVDATGNACPSLHVASAVYAAFWDDRTAHGFLHSHSYTGNPLACRAALATLDLFAQTDALHQNLGTSERLAAQFAPISKHPRVRFDRRKGMVFAWHVLSTPARLRPPLCLPRAGAGAAAAPHRPHDLRHLIDDALVRQ